MSFLSLELSLAGNVKKQRRPFFWREMLLR